MAIILVVALVFTVSSVTITEAFIEETLSSQGDRLAAIETKLTAMETTLQSISSLLSSHVQDTKYGPSICYNGMARENLQSRIVIEMFDLHEALCDTKTDGGGWIIIQRRISGDVDFYRGWDDYKHGFGNVLTDYWLGNEVLHKLTTDGNYELRVDIEDVNKRKYYAHYSSFDVGSENSSYELFVGAYSGNAGDSFMEYNKMAFSTKDKDTDKWPFGSCAERYHGAWWYNGCAASNLNGKWTGQDDEGMYWREKEWVFVRSSEMKIRRV